MPNQPRIIVLDDDPTGSQTVHGCLLLMTWDVETLHLGLSDESPIFFILTNTRSMTPEEADAVTREVCRNLKTAIAQSGVEEFLVVSRSDSTLRGHYPIETDAIADELGPFDAHFLTPAFFEGGRMTRHSIHYLMVDGVPTPVHETEFARDSVFGYQHSYLPAYVEEKTKGRIPASSVERFQLADIRAGSVPRLMQLHDNQCGVVDGEVQADLNQFAADVMEAAAQGKRFLFRSAASLLTALAALPPQPTPPEEMGRYTRDRQPGVIVVGSHVRKTTEQLAALLEAPGIVGIEVNVLHLLDDSTEQREALLQHTLERIEQVYGDRKTPVIYTSREELTFPDVPTRLAFGIAVSDLLMDIVQQLPPDLGFLISKGGITSNDVLSKGLALKTARLLGQILPGCSMIRTPSDHPRYPDLPVVLFPGNVGDRHGLVDVYHRLNRVEG
ncbi:MAG: four-carbon acid sugar kinase family protein [Synechococcales cyanobacterium T60_A2020_003]|nr:four-carbon acid sugar kinase family protein [Synechococcales cyanobacterium T60_A2020_003]